LKAQIANLRVNSGETILYTVTIAKM